MQATPINYTQIFSNNYLRKENETETLEGIQIGICIKN